MTKNRFEHGGNIYNIKTKEGQMPLLDFSANINPLGLSDKVRAAIADNIDKVIHYPDPDMTELKEAVAKYYSVKKESLVLGNGATELLYLLCRICVPKKVLLPVPSFSEYEKAAVSANLAIEYFQLDEQRDFFADYGQIIKHVDENTLIFLGNPNNPTGKLLAQDGFYEFLNLLENKNSWLVLDESFIDFLEAPEKHSLRRFYEKHDNLFIIHSMTKFFAIPGLRLGFGIFPEEMAAKIKMSTDCWNVNLLAQKAGIAALSDEEYIKKSRIELNRLRSFFLSELKSIEKIKVFEPASNFILLDISLTGMNSSEICEKMREKNILVRNCENYPGLHDRYIRIAVRTESENERFITTLKEFL